VQTIFSCSFVDQDMLMQYLWGFAVGHAYAYDGVAASDMTNDNNSLLVPTKSNGHFQFSGNQRLAGEIKNINSGIYCLH
jgi:hypothetical protein